MTRDRFQELLWDYLYDLLEAEGPDSKAAFEALLKDDAQCQQWLAAAKEQKTLLATAAKQAAPGEFKAPVNRPEPVGVRTVDYKERRGVPGRWVIAVALILIVGVCGATPLLSEQRTLTNDVQAAEAELAKLETHYRTAKMEQDKLAADVSRAELRSRDVARRQEVAVQKLRKEARDDQFFVTVARPQVYEAGAPYKLLVNTRNLNDEPVKADLEVKVLDPQNAIAVPAERIFIVETKDKPGNYEVCLPQDLDPKKHSELRVEIVAKNQKGLSEKVAERLKLFDSFFVTHVTTDKPMYLPGETVYYRSLTLERFSLKPTKELLTLNFTLTDGKGQKVHEERRRAEVMAENQVLKGPDGAPVRGLGCGAFTLPADAPGGEYTLTVAEQNGRFPPEQRKFIVNKYEKPRLKKELEFNRKSYGPGDEVQAVCKVTAAEGGKPLANLPVSATINIDGKQYGANGAVSAEPMKLATDATGGVIVRFTLPKQMERGIASLAVQFTDGANVETLVRPIPVVVSKVFLGLFPEGGDLVAGVNSRVYFHARTPLDKPAELKARLLDEAGKEVAKLETFTDDKEPGANQGVGVFNFTPVAGQRYSVEVDQPAGAIPDYKMPAIKEAGIVMQINEGVGQAGGPIHVALRNVGPARNLLVGAYCRGQVLDQQAVRIGENQTLALDLKTQPSVGGVYRVTVFEEKVTSTKRKLEPLAERLIFRGSANRLNVKLSTLRGSYLPAEKAGLRIETMTEKNQPVGSILMVAVVDKNVLTLADEKTARAMPTHFLLTSEVRKPEELEHTDFLLTDHPKAATVLDLLLGTQGWRRFAEQMSPDEFRKNQPELAEQFLARQGADLAPVLQSNYEEVARRLDKQMELEARERAKPFDGERQQAAAELQEASLKLDSFKNGTTAGLLANYPFMLEMAKEKLANATAELSARRETFLPLALGFAVFAGLLCLIVYFWPRIARWLANTPSLPGIIILLGLVVVVCLAAISFIGTQASTTFSDVGNTLSTGGWANAPVERRENWRVGGGGMGRPASTRPLPTPVPPPARGIDGEAAAELRYNPAPAAPGAPAGGAAAAVPPPAPPMAMPMEAVPPANKDVLKVESPRPEGQDAPRYKFDAKDESANREGKADVRELRKEAGQNVGGKLPADAGDRAQPKDKEERLGLGSGQPATDTARKLREPQGPAIRARGGLEQAKKPMGPVNIPPAPAGTAGPGGGGGGGRGLDIAQAKTAEVAAEPIIIREYAHTRTSGTSTARTDFAETLLWRPIVVLQGGTGTVNFELGDSITTYEAIAYAHAPDGRLGAGKITFEAKLPFNVEPKLPIEITATDEVVMPVAVSNGIDTTQTVNLGLQVQNLAVEGPVDPKLELAAQSRGRALFRYRSLIPEGEARIALTATGESAFSDSLQRRLRVVPDGFPIVESRSGQLEELVTHEIELPASWVKGTLRLHAAAYPTTLADLQQGLEGLLREPYGCFEQTSSSSYPNALVLDYLKSTQSSNPQAERRARDLLDRGYTKLVGFECYNASNTRRGYEWFGGRAAPHEALTAYGLLQFSDMARLRSIDTAMLERTRKYLLDQRDGKGGFKRNARALDGFGRAPELVTNAYIVWSLTEAGTKEDLTAELIALKAATENSKDGYVLALVANSLLNVGQREEAIARLKKLVTLQQAEGKLVGESTSITHSGGRDLEIETTALALLAWLKLDPPGEFQPAVNKAIQWLTSQRGGHGAFGSTQSTILALKALVAYAKKNARPITDGEVILWANGQELARVPFTAKAQDAIELKLENAEQVLKPGKNRVRVLLTGKNSFPYTLRWSYQAVTPLSDAGCPVKIQTTLDKTKLAEGDAARLSVKVKNASGKGQGMAVAIIGLPAGMTLPEDFKQLKDHARLRDDDTKPGLIAAWETRGRELILYWRDLAPDQEIEVLVDLVARVPGKYRGPASRAYLYYNADQKHWIEPLSVEISPK